jgi:hypothetical protein
MRYKPLSRETVSAILRGTAEGQKTNRELALDLLQRLIALETERNSMAWILQFARDPQTQQPLDWRALVRKDFSEGETTQDSVLERYAQLRESLIATQSDCPNALPLLLSVCVERVWEKPW